MSDRIAPRLLGIAGSPRRDGNSDRLLDACLGGAEEAGATIDRLVVATSGVSPCRECGACSKDGVCTLEDGMQAVYPRLDAADVIVVASPVFFATVPAVLKALYDRCQPYWERRYELHRPIGRRRPGALLVVGGGGDPFGATCAITTTRSVFAVLGLDYVQELIVRADRPSDIVAQPAELARAAAIGAALAADAADRISAS
jgi:multimeric flavodoxin WrbA